MLVVFPDLTNLLVITLNPFHTIECSKRLRRIIVRKKANIRNRFNQKQSQNGPLLHMLVYIYGSQATISKNIIEPRHENSN